MFGQRVTLSGWMKRKVHVQCLPFTWPMGHLRKEQLDESYLAISSTVGFLNLENDIIFCLGQHIMVSVWHAWLKERHTVPTAGRPCTVFNWNGNLRDKSIVAGHGTGSTGNSVVGAVIRFLYNPLTLSSFIVLFLFRGAASCTQCFKALSWKHNEKLH